MAITNIEKAECIADSLRSQFTPHADVIDVHDSSIICPVVEQYLATPTRETLQHTSPSEIMEYFHKLKVRKSPGADRITSRMLLNLPDNLIIFLCYVINCMLSLNYFPAMWKKAIVVPIPKSGLNHTDPTNFRPISLLSCLSKVYEFVLSRRFDEFCDRQELIAPDQMGFRKKHSTVHQLLRVTELVHHGYMQGQVTGALFVDIAKAFDKVWHTGLIYKLIISNFPNSLIHLLNDYLTNRSFCVRVNDTLSAPRQILSGVPQGSILGPKLFNLYINDVPRSPGIHLALYADDTAVLVQHKQTHVVFNTLQMYMLVYANWLRRWRIKVNASKCATVLFRSTHSRAIVPDGNILLNGAPIPWTDDYKYLGIYLDAKLTWQKQTKEVLCKATAAKRSLITLLNNRAGLPLRYKLLLYKSYVTPVMTYASPIWGTAAKTHLQKLQVFQNKTLRSYTSMPNYYNTEELHKELRIRPLLTTFKKLAAKFHSNLYKVPNPILHHLPVYDPAVASSRKRPRGLLYNVDDPFLRSKRKRT